MGAFALVRCSTRREFLSPSDGPQNFRSSPRETSAPSEPWAEVELDAEKRVLEDRLRDWTRQLEAGRVRIEEIDDAVRRAR